ncbi:MAG TPA: helix-turn-helix domain-containing protein [Candidatus Aquilonibacter sp.]|nr:helix-turn-helix domain-containing protein [Candidatus Aquilonibacter sp.]
MKRVIFVLTERVELFDAAGPAQVFHEANAAGADYALVFAAASAEVTSVPSLTLARLHPLPDDVGPSDTIVVPGSGILREDACARRARIRPLVAWLRRAYDAGARVCSVCVGAFALGAAGLLNGRHVTTHWKYIEALQQAFPNARVATNRLYIFDGRIATSAGIASGVDLALAIVERDAGARIAAIAAREMVVGVRRAGADEQLSPYFHAREHVFAEVHAAQDWLVEHLDEPYSLESLARIAGVSSRTLTRQFRAATGGTVKDYATSLRLALARELLRDRSLKVEEVAERCGLRDGRHLRRLWRERFGASPSHSRGAEA